MMPSVAPYRSLNAERGAVQIPDGMGEQTELIGPIPNAVLDVAPIRRQIAPERQNHGEGVLGYAVDGVVANVGDGQCRVPCNTPRPPVVAGGGHRDHFQLRELAQSLRAHRYLVDDGDGRPASRGTISSAAVFSCSI